MLEGKIDYKKSECVVDEGRDEEMCDKGEGKEDEGITRVDDKYE